MGKFSNKERVVSRSGDKMRRGKTDTDTDVCKRERFCWDTVELQGEGVKGKGEARRKRGTEGADRETDDGEDRG